MRNALFADLLITTGLRLEEASGLLVHEVEALDRPEGAPQVWFRVSSGLAKGGRGRQVLIPTRLVRSLLAYVAIERRSACAKFMARDGWVAIDRPIFVRAPVAGSRIVLRDGGSVSADALTPGERARLVVCDAEGAPREAAALWLTEVGQPVRPNSWEAVFARASKRCAEAGHPLRVSPHDLRHSFAVHMLAMLVQRRLAEAGRPGGEAEGYRQLLGDPLQQVQRLLGHASLTTTSIYLDHVACCTDTVDTAMEDLLALLPREDPR
jgi:integrase